MSRCHHPRFKNSMRTNPHGLRGNGVGRPIHPTRGDGGRDRTAGRAREPSDSTAHSTGPSHELGLVSAPRSANSPILTAWEGRLRKLYVETILTTGAIESCLPTYSVAGTVWMGPAPRVSGHLHATAWPLQLTTTASDGTLTLPALMAARGSCGPRRGNTQVSSYNYAPWGPIKPAKISSASNGHS